mmetsp:Transcript_28621/g.52246  ORF Transcript_28621/g.52246 Transcript_28621/m.52246 type:complete len:154 (-) Transcript_28621:489-950(-)
MMLRPLLILSLSFAASPASAFHINASPKKLPATTALMAEQHTTRRVAVQRATSASLGLLTTLVSTAATTIATAEPANADVIRSPGKCANGEGEGCDSLAGDNALIQSLQRKSSENREANQRVGNTIKGDFGFVGWAAVAVILNDLTSSYLEKR